MGAGVVGRGGKMTGAAEAAMPTPRTAAAWHTHGKGSDAMVYFPLLAVSPP